MVSLRKLLLTLALVVSPDMALAQAQLPSPTQVDPPYGDLSSKTPTTRWIASNTATSFNGRQGAIVLIANDVAAFLPAGSSSTQTITTPTITLTSGTDQGTNYGSYATASLGGQWGTGAAVGHPFAWRWVMSDTLANNGVTEWPWGPTCNFFSTWAMGVKQCNFTNVIQRGGNLSGSSVVSNASVINMGYPQFGTGIPDGGGTVTGAFKGQAKNVQPQVIIGPGAANLNYVANEEIGGNIGGGASVNRFVGLTVSHYGGHINPGLSEDSAYSVSNTSGSAPYNTIFEIAGDATDDSTGLDPSGATGVSSTMFLVNPKRFPSYGGPPGTGRGVDLGAGTVADLAWNSPNASIDGTGVETIAKIASSGVISAITPRGGSGYYELPSMVIQAPTPSGVQAVAHVTAMAATLSIPAFKRVAYTLAPVVGGGISTITLPGTAPTDLVANNLVFGGGVPANCAANSVTGAVVVEGCAMVAAPNGAALNSHQIIGITNTAPGTICSAGTWYFGLTSPGGGAAPSGTFKCSAGAVTSVSLLDPGGMLNAPSVLTLPNGGNTCSTSGLNGGVNGLGCAMDGVAGAPTFTVQMGGWLYYTAGGSGHAVNDVLTLGNGSTTTVTKIGTGGAIVSLSTPTAGNWATLPTSGGKPLPQVTPSATTGSGNVAATTIQMAWTPLTTVVDNGGSGYYGGADIQFISKYGGSHVIPQLTMSSQDVLTTSPTGWTLGAPTGGAMGVNTLNTKGLFVNGRAATTTRANVVDTCGAPTDGATDASSIFNSCEATYGKVDVPAGTFIVKNLVPVTGGGFVGAGAGQTILKLPVGSDGADVVRCTNAYTLFGSNTSTGVADSFELAGLTIDGNVANQANSARATTNGIACYGQLWNWHDLVIQNVSGMFMRTGFQNTGGGGTSSIGLGQFRNIRMISAGLDGIMFDGPHDSMFSHIDIENACTSADNTYSSFNSVGGNGVIVAAHMYAAGAAPNRCQQQVNQPNGFWQNTNLIAEGGRTQAVFGQAVSCVNCDFFAQFPAGNATGTSMVKVTSNKVRIADSRFHAFSVAAAGTTTRDVHALELDSGGGNYDGNIWDEFDVSGMFNFVSDTGNDIFTGSGSTSGPGTSPLFVGSLPRHSTILVTQSGNAQSIMQFGNLNNVPVTFGEGVAGAPPVWQTLTPGGTYTAGTEQLLYSLSATAGQTFTLPVGTLDGQSYQICAKSGAVTAAVFAATAGQTVATPVPATIGVNKCATFTFRLSALVWSATFDLDPTAPGPLGATTPNTIAATTLTHGLQVISTAATQLATPGVSGSTLTVLAVTELVRIVPAAPVTAITITLPTPAATQTKLVIRCLTQPLNAASITWAGAAVAATVPVALPANTSLTLWWDAGVSLWTL